MGMTGKPLPLMRKKHDMVVPVTLMAAIMLLLPPLQTLAWWLLLPCLISLILRWHIISVLLLLAAITYADSWWSVSYFLLIVILWLMRMYSQPKADNQEQLKSALAQIILTTPVLVVLLMLVMLAGNRWSERSESGRSSTGISDTMTPGSVSELVNDSELAMRVRFDNEVDLYPEDLYWRGLVLENFDGKTWSRSQRLDFDITAIPEHVAAESRLRYLVTLEPTQQTWLYGLNQAYPTRPQTYRDKRGIIVTSDVIRQRVRYPVTSIPPQKILTLNQELRERNLALPDSGNSQSRNLARRLRSQFSDDKLLIDAVLRQFSEQPFVYTLTPALNSEQSVDDFLFNTQEGFCEHYAGAMTFILRAAGIPARVVAGYQGGRFNNVTGHWRVSQYNAHAWVEAWLPGVGWQRLDPTAAIAPERVMSGLDAWLSTLNDEARQELDPEIRLRLFFESIPGYNTAVETLEAIQYGWDLSMYDNEGNLRTEDLSHWLDSRGLGDLPVWLLVFLLVFVGLRSMFIGRQDRQHVSPAIRAYRRLNKKLYKVGLHRKPSETMLSHMHRVSSVCPDLAGQCRELGQLLTEAEYKDEKTEYQKIVKKIVEFHPYNSTKD